MFISNIRPSFHLWRKENLVKHQKVSKYYETDCCKSSIKELLKDLLDKMKGFKYQITAKNLLKKLKENRDFEFAPVSFNSTAKTVINFEKYIIDESFQ